MPVIGGYISGQILYAANLNTNFAQSANIFGDAFSGTVTAPNLNATSDVYGNIIIANTSVIIGGLDVRSSILQASANANSAYAEANAAFNNANNNSNQIQAAFNQANSALITAGGGISGSGAVMSGALTINNTLNAQNTITSNAEIHSSANAQIYGGQFRAIQGNYGAILRNDGASFYIQTTGNVPLGQVGTVMGNGLTPFKINLLTGGLTLDANGVGTSFGGSITATGISAQYVNATTLSVSTLTTGGTYVLSQKDSGTVIYYNNSQPLFVNVNSNLYVGFRTVVTQVNSGSVTFRAGPNVLLNTRTGTLNQIAAVWSSASIVGYAPGAFILDGNIQ